MIGVWKRFLMLFRWCGIVIKEFRANHGFDLSAELAFWFFYSIFPFLIFLFALAGFFPPFSDEAKILNLLYSFLPPPIYELIGSTLASVLVKPKGLIALTTLLFALWSASNAVHSMMGTLNRICGVQESRPYWKTKGVALILTVTLCTVFLITFLLLVIGPLITQKILEILKWNHFTGTILGLVRLAIAVLGLYIALLLVYRFGPDIPRHTLCHLPGTALAIAGGLIISHLFGLYLQKVAVYNKFYGALGMVIAFMTWLYALGVFILLGGQANSFLLRKSPEFEAQNTTNQPTDRLSNHLDDLDYEYTNSRRQG